MSALQNSVDINVISHGILRLLLNHNDSLADLNLSKEEHLLIAKSVEFSDVVLHLEDPLTLRDALRGPNRNDWIAAIREEMQSLQDNDTFDLDDSNPIPSHLKALSTKWVFRHKVNADDTIRYKARLVVRGFLQKEGIDFDQTYAPVATQTSFRLLLVLAARLNWNVRQLDVITAFLNPKIDKENLWVSIPAGTFNHCPPFPNGPVLRLKKALYGLRQSPRLWWATIDAAFISLGLTRGVYDTNIYFSKDFIVLLYVDDTLIFDLYPESGNNSVARLIDTLMGMFKMKDLGRLKRFLGYNISYGENGTIYVSQTSYIASITSRHGLVSASAIESPVDEKNRIDISHCADKLLDEAGKQNYQSIVGALLYAALGTRADVCFAVAALSRHCANPFTSHMSAAKRVLRYLYTTRDLCLMYTKDVRAPLDERDPEASVSPVTGYCDADWASNITDRRSISGYTFFIGKSLISWKAKRQTIVALSTAEAELIACTEASREGIWLKNLLSEVVSLTKITLPGSSCGIRIYCDNQSALKGIAKGTSNPSGRNKHIDIRYYHARDMAESKVIIFNYVNSADNLADIMTKGMPLKKHREMTVRLGIVKVLEEDPRK